jgi:hypothetical protein
MLLLCRLISARDISVRAMAEDDWPDQTNVLLAAAHNDLVRQSDIDL